MNLIDSKDLVKKSGSKKEEREEGTRVRKDQWRDRKTKGRMDERKERGRKGGWKKEEGGSCFISTCTSENVTKSPDS